MTRWHAEQHWDDDILFRLGEADDGSFVIAEWPGLATLRADPRGEHVRFSPCAGANAADVARLRHGFAEALLRHLRGELTLHASVCTKDRRAILALGTSGAGKSSFAASLCSLQGFALACDDFAPIEWRGRRACVAPRDRDHRIDEDAARALALTSSDTYSDGKLRVEAPAAADEPTPISAIVALSFDDRLGAPTLERLSGVQAIAPLVSSVMRFALRDGERHKRELLAFDRLYRAVPVFELRRPRDLGMLDRSAQLAGDLLQRRPG